MSAISYVSTGRVVTVEKANFSEYLTIIFRHRSFTSC